MTKIIPKTFMSIQLYNINHELSEIGNILYLVCGTYDLLNITSLFNLLLIKYYIDFQKHIFFTSHLFTAI